MKGKNIIVSGYKGFIGSHLVDRLVDLEYTVIGLDKKDGTSTADFEQLLKTIKSIGKVEVFVHLGANCSSQISLRDPQTDFIDNVIGTFNVCEASRLYGNFPIIFNSSMKVYPGEDGIVPPYGKSKLVGEMYLKMYKDVYGIPYVINRPSTVYGPRQEGSHDGGWFTWFIKASITKDRIRLYGDGTQSRDVLYVDDCVDLLVDQVENLKTYLNKEYDFGGGVENEVSLNQLLDELNYHDTDTYPKLIGDVQRFVNSNECLKGIWEPKIGWREGLERTKAYFLEK